MGWQTWAIGLYLWKKIKFLMFFENGLEPRLVLRYIHPDDELMFSTFVYKSFVGTTYLDIIFPQTHL